MAWGEWGGGGGSICGFYLPMQVYLFCVSSRLAEDRITKSLRRNVASGTGFTGKQKGSTGTKLYCLPLFMAILESTNNCTVVLLSAFVPSRIFKFTFLILNYIE